MGLGLGFLEEENGSTFLGLLRLIEGICVLGV